ncbi:MAG: tRNA (adenosine(37)-N6)-threonylcarbamoyltransferase complex ATPase subunit type 1 TsaE [bacterium]|nr:tRNA (adenosine(37)-N6)-threonylcarbamoyltransferase complex ATPase subunit type 1 TsaE [bacterium]
MFTINSESSKKTEKIAEKISLLLSPGDVICLIGELGAGKTCFSKGLIRALGVKNKYVVSPTFTIINEYQGKYPIYHFDLYRLKNENELEALGFEEYFYGKGITLIEWADKMKKLLPKDRLEIYFSYVNENTRRIILKPKGKLWVSRDMESFSENIGS